MTTPDVVSVPRDELGEILWQLERVYGELKGRDTTMSVIQGKLRGWLSQEKP